MRQAYLLFKFGVGALDTPPATITPVLLRTVLLLGLAPLTIAGANDLLLLVGLALL